MDDSTLYQLVPLGLPASRQWLMTQGVSASRLDNALKSGKLRLLTTGLYDRPGLPLRWEGVVCALQREEPGIALGGLAAMDLAGRGHYIRQGSRERLDLYAPGPAPGWLSRLHLQAAVHWRRTARLWRKNAGDLSDFHTREHVWLESLPPLKVSTLERALLELLSLVPAEVTFELADNLVQGLTSLSPARLADLLKQCKNVKAKRLFFWFARRHGYGWSQKLNVADFDLGSGKRVVAVKGRLDKDLMITVPEAMYGSP